MARLFGRRRRIEPAAPSAHAERLVATVGGGLSILLIGVTAESFLGIHGAGLMVASMGATAVLLFAVPTGPLSQPWPVLGGHFLSAIIGVAVARLIGDVWLAAAVAVGLAIGVMHLARCIHPPGGATALTAVLGGDAVRGLGFQFVLTPVMLNALVIVALAAVLNAPFAWRRYPVMRRRGLAEAARPVEETNP